MWGRDERKCSGWFESLEKRRTKKTTLWQTPFWLGATKITVLIQEESNMIPPPPQSSSEQQQRVSWSLIRHCSWHISSFCSTHKGRKAPVEGRCWTRSKRHRLTETWIHIFLTRGLEHVLVLLCPSWFTTFGEIFSILINTDVSSSGTWWASCQQRKQCSDRQIMGSLVSRAEQCCNYHYLLGGLRHCSDWRHLI